MKIGSAAAIAILIAVSPYQGNAAEQCDGHAFGIQIDNTAQTLRTLNRESERRFQDRLTAIAKVQGWTEAQKADKAAAAMDDSKLETFNAQIEQLVGQLDALNVMPQNDVSCERLNELKALNDKLVAVMRQKAGFILAQLESEGSKPPISPYSPVAPAPAQVAAVKSGQLPQIDSATQENNASGDVPWSANVAKALRPQAQQPVTDKPTPDVQKPTKSASSTDAPLPLRPSLPDSTKTASLQPQASDAVPPLQTSKSLTGYSPQDIRNAGEGVFGTLTSEFAAVMNHAFAKFGQPNAYIMGDEGGGAFLAGLRYGKGTLYSRVNGVESAPTSIYWQGPSLGADIGATGTRTLFLVYNLDGVSDLYKRYPGIEGAAYVAGGFGLTVYRGGNTMIVPIRTGIGLRLGASVAYLKFTDHSSWNPF